jgi:hypothetical protein
LQVNYFNFFTGLLTGPAPGTGLIRSTGICSGHSCQAIEFFKVVDGKECRS